MYEFPESDLVVFKLRYRAGKKNECWEWTAGKSSEGYGSFYFEGKVHGAHRIAWCIANGYDPRKLTRGMYICHTCDNPVCVNPRHLELGSAKSNNLQKVKHYKNLGARKMLSRKQVESIRRKYVRGWTLADLSKKYGVGVGVIGRAIRQKGAYRDYPLAPKIKAYLERRTASRNQTRPLSKKEIKRLKKQYKKGMVVNDLAEKYGVSVPTIYNYLGPDLTN